MYHKTAEPQGEVTVTTDGGRSWHSWLLPAPRSGFEPFGALPICHGDDCVATIMEYDGASDLSHLTISPDGDIAQQLTPGHRSWTLSSCPTATWCAGIDEGIDEGGVGAAGEADTAPGLLTSNDGGGTWATRRFPQWLVPPGDLVQGTLSCPAVDQCVMAGTLKLGLARPDAAQRAASRYGDSVGALTTDGGLTWKQSALPAGLSGLGSLACTDTVHCLALASTPTGQPSRVVRSDDAGKTWSPVTAPFVATLHLANLVCADTAHCLLYGTVAESSSPLAPSRAVMYRSTDGGVSWQRSPLPEGTTLFSATCPSPTFCVATGFRPVSRTFVGAEGDTVHFVPVNVPTLLTTHDGGISWHETGFPRPRQLTP